MTSQRLDKWLWFTRLVKSRSQAARLISTGKVRVNGERINKPATMVGIEDVITAVIHKQLHIVKVLALGERRGPASEAQTLYEDLSPEPEATHDADNGQNGAILHPVAERARGTGRPTKRQRRQTDALRTPAFYDQKTD